MSSNLQNSIWPNAGGTLGEIKVQIPDGVTTPWPTGDALVGNFVFNKGKLVGLVDTKALIANDSKTTTFPYDYVQAKFDSIKESDMTFVAGERTKNLVISYGSDNTGNSGELVLIRFENMSEETKTMFRSARKVIDNVLYDAGNNVIGEFDTNTIETASNILDEDTGETVDGKDMDALYCNLDMVTGEEKGYIITEFKSDLSSLTDGTYMFALSEIRSFKSDLSSLTNGNGMFTGCSRIESFDSDLSSLTNGFGMFNCTTLTSFSSNLSSLTNGNGMFSGCSRIESFDSDLPNLTNGEKMFYVCGELKSFNCGDLSSLTNGTKMFYDCELDTDSVQRIADTINTYNGTIHIGIGNSEPNDEETTAFNTIASKGWTVYVNGSRYTPTSSAAIATLDENGTETVTPIPFWAKPINSDEEHAKYTDSDGNFYNILGAQFIYGDSLDTYGMFTCEEDAATQMGLTKIEK